MTTTDWSTSDSVTDDTSTAAPEPLPPLRTGDKVHILGTLTWIYDNSHHQVVTFGTEITISDLMFEANRDRFGNSILDSKVLDNEQEQIRRWGEVKVRRGPWPDGVARLIRGSQEWWEQAEVERQAAWKIDNPQERAEALRAHRAKYGIQPTSKTLATYRDDKRDPQGWA